MDRSGGKRRGYTVGLAIYQDATNEEASHPSADSTHHPIVKVQEMASVVQDLHAGTTLVGGSGPRLPKGPDLQEIIASSLSHIPHACLGWRDRVSAEAEVNEVMLPHCHCYSTWILGLGYLERLPVLEKGLSF
jgi:hypothetical protein